MVLGTVKQDACPQERRPKVLKTKLTRGDHLVRVHSDQMVLVMVRWEAGPREKQPKMLKGELENNSRKPRGLVSIIYIGTALKRFNLVFLRVR